MSERNNIDRLFQEKFKDFEVTPSEQVWTNIQSKMNKKEKKTSLLPLWLRLCSFAAVFLIGFAVATTFIAGPFGLKNPFIEEKNFNVPSEDETTTSNQATVSAPEAGTESSDKNSEAPVVVNNTAAESSTSGKSLSTSANKQDNIASGFGTGSKNSGRKIPSASTGQNAPAYQNSDKDGSSKNNSKGLYSRSAKNSVTSNSAMVANGAVNGTNRSATKPSAASENNTSNDTASPAANNVTVSPMTTVSAESSNLTQENAGAVENKNAIAEEPEHHFIDSKKTKVAHEAGGRYVASNADSRSKISTSDKTANETSDKNNTVNPVNELSIADKSATDKTLEKGVSVVIDSAAAASKEVAEKSEDEKAKEEKEKDKKEKGSKWIVSSTFSPVYMNMNGSGSALDSKFAENSKTYQTSMSYGVGVKYALSKKWSVRTGLNLLNFEYNTNNLTFYYSTNGAGLEHVSENGAGSGIVIENPDPKGIAYDDNGIVTTRYTGIVNHKMNYVEVPLEASYKLLNKRFGIDLIGGVSSMFLNDNRVSVVSSEANTNIGEANNLNKIHFSTNVGLGLRYNFMKTLQANVEPMFKYQINTYNGDAGNFKPYFFGVYTGLSFSF